MKVVGLDTSYFQDRNTVFWSLRTACRLAGPRTTFLMSLLAFGKVLLGIVDLIGVALLSAFFAAALNEASSSQVEVPGPLGSITQFNSSPIVLLYTALFFMASKSVLSFLLSSGLTKTVNSKVSEVIFENSENIALADKDWTDQFTTQELHFLLTAGTRSAISGIILPASVIISESALLCFFLLFLFSVNWIASLVSLFILSASSLLLYRFLSKRLYKVGQLTGSGNISSMEYFQESVHGYRELLVRGTLFTHSRKFSDKEAELSQLLTRQSILGLLPRHILETIVIISLGAVATAVSVGQTTKESLLLLTIFSATTARILPSLIPLQSALSELNTNMGLSEKFMTVFGSRQHYSSLANVRNSSKKEAPVDGLIEISCSEVSYRYPSAKKLALSKISFNFEGPGWFAIDGPSGSGKSTLFDLLLGIKNPSEGDIHINGLSPREFINENPGVCAYLPQRIITSNSSIAENVAFGSNIDQIDVELVKQLLWKVGLEGLLARSPEGVWQTIGELGRTISGGQLQRLGIARCLYTSPKILLLDESTSGLDKISQEQILSLFSELSEEIQIVSISHDRRIVNRASSVIELRDGCKVSGDD
jgi:ABC-type transport system involved in cytochrome bd biosynthesis fused ATPase/permease subunit